jgi:hypothetical protein
MALTISNLTYNVQGSENVVRGTIDFDSSYPTGGEPLTAANIGLATIKWINFQDAAGFSFTYDYTNAKVVAKCPGVVTGAAGAGTLDDFPLSGVGSTAASIGLTAGNATTRFGGQVEVADTTDLSTVTGVRFTAYGF